MWKNRSMEIDGNCISCGVLNNVIMLKLDWYNDKIIFNRDCDSCEIQCYGNVCKYKKMKV
jgi:hypothetical protein